MRHLRVASAAQRHLGKKKRDVSPPVCPVCHKCAKADWETHADIMPKRKRDRMVRAPHHERDKTPHRDKGAMPLAWRGATPRRDMDTTSHSDRDIMPYRKKGINHHYYVNGTSQRGRDMLPNTPRRDRASTPHNDSGAMPSCERDATLYGDRHTRACQDRVSTSHQNQDSTPHHDIDTTLQPDSVGVDRLKINQALHTHVVPIQLPEPRKAGMDVTKPKGKRMGYNGSLATTVTLQKHIEENSDNSPRRLRSTSLGPAGRSSVSFAEAALNIFDGGKPHLRPKWVSPEVRARWTDPITHQNPDPCYTGVAEPVAPCMEDAAGLSSSRKHYLDNTWITLPSGVMKAEYSLEPGEGDPLHQKPPKADCTTTARRPSRWAQTANDNWWRRVLPKHLNNEDMREILMGRKVKNGMGEWVRNIAGGEDLLPGCTLPHQPGDRLVSPRYRAINDRKSLSLAERIDNGLNRPDEKLAPPHPQSRASEALLDCLFHASSHYRRHAGPRPPTHACPAEVGGSNDLATLASNSVPREVDRTQCVQTAIQQLASGGMPSYRSLSHSSLVASPRGAGSVISCSSTPRGVVVRERMPLTTGPGESTPPRSARTSPLQGYRSPSVNSMPTTAP